jgi:hypothetical protein
VKRDYAKTTGGGNIFTDGGSEFQQFGRFSMLYILASNASVWHIPKYIKQDERWGFLYQLDHLNASTGEKFTRVKHCNEMPRNKKEEDENCTTKETKVNKLMNVFCKCFWKV